MNSINPSENLDWALVIIASRESLPNLLLTLKAALIGGEKLARIDILINGNSQLSTQVTDHLAGAVARVGGLPAVVPSITCRIWSIPIGDKANAWNQYLHHVWAGEKLVFFIDGYVRLRPNAVANLGLLLTANSNALAGAGVPSSGRSAARLKNKMVADNGLHGNFWCVRGAFLRQLRDRKFQLPVGLYRVDSLLGAIFCYDLDPGPNLWEDYRIVAGQDASWETDPKHWWRVEDLHAFVKRKLRQVRGELEIRAFREHLTFCRQPGHTLPDSASRMVLSWASSCPEDLARALNCHPLAWMAMRKFRSETMPNAAMLEARLVSLLPLNAQQVNVKLHS